MNMKMFKTPDVSISKNLIASFSPLLYLFRLFGIFPLTIKRNKFGLFFKWSPTYSIYSYIFASLMITVALYVNLTQRFMEYLKLDGQSVIDDLVSLFPITGYCIGAFFGVFYMASQVTKLLNYFKIINQVDSIIKTEYNKFKKYKSLFVPIITFINSEILHVLSILIFKTLLGSKLEIFKKIFIKHAPFLMTIYISLLVEFLIRLLTYNLELRFIRLNQVLREHYLEIKTTEAIKARRIVTVIEVRDETIISGTLDKNKNMEILLSYNKAYLKLTKAADIINDLAGLNILVTIVVTTFDLISTSYFLILILWGKVQGQLLFIISVMTYNVLRVLVITEPLYSCMLKMKATATQVSNLLSLNTDPDYKRQVKIFALCIYLKDLKFTACGLFNVDRFLIAELIGGLTNYVVILLGFK